MDEKLKKAILNAAEDVLGLPPEEMEENMDLDLFEEGLIDSVGCAALIAAISDLLHKNISIAKLDAKDFVSLNAIGAAIERVTK